MQRIKLGIVEDSTACVKGMRDFLDIFNKELAQYDVKVEYDIYSNPVDYKLRVRDFDIVILDYYFSSYTYGANGFYVARFTKEQDETTKVIVSSSYSKHELADLFYEFKESIDGYAHKKQPILSSEEGLGNVLMKQMIELGIISEKIASTLKALFISRNIDIALPT